MIGFFLARILLGRKQHELGRASAYATIEAQLTQKLAASQSTSQVVHVGNSAGLMPDGTDDNYYDNVDGEHDSIHERAFGIDGILSAVLDGRGDVVHRRNASSTSQSRLEKGETL